MLNLNLFYFSDVKIALKQSNSHAKKKPTDVESDDC